MQQAFNRETIRTLAEANGLHIPEERLDRVLRQYQNYMRLIDRLDAFALEREEEPATTFTQEKAAEQSGPANPRR